VDVKKETMREFAGDVRLMYLEFMDAGFDSEQALALTKEYVNSAGFVTCKQIFDAMLRKNARASKSDVMRGYMGDSGDAY
jgi:hypothetical protein